MERNHVIIKYCNIIIINLDMDQFAISWSNTINGSNNNSNTELHLHAIKLFFLSK